MLSRIRQTPTSAWTSTTSVQMPTKACPSFTHTQIGCGSAVARISARMWSKVHRNHCWRKQAPRDQLAWGKYGTGMGTEPVEKWKNLKTKTSQWPGKQQRKHRRKTMVWNHRLCFRMQFIDNVKGEDAVSQECELLALTGSFLSPRAGENLSHSALKLPIWQDDFPWVSQTTLSQKNSCTNFLRWEKPYCKIIILS